MKFGLRIVEKPLKQTLNMEEYTPPTVTINIHGGNVQILPNATKAEQHFHFASDETHGYSRSFPTHSWTEEDETRLSFYVSNKEELSTYVATLTACRTAREVGEVVARMCADDPKLTQEQVVKEKFIAVLLPFLTGVGKGKGIDNLRLHINDAWAAYKKGRQKK